MSKAKTLATTVSTGGALEDPNNIPAADIDGLATVATSGAYNDLSGKPSLATVATTGAYGDIVGTAGTANGVMYLNGSKVLTTGSALVFDGTSLGIGVASPTAPLDISKATTGVFAKFSGLNVSETSQMYLGTDADDATNAVYIATNNTTGNQRLSIRSSGVPQFKIDRLPNSSTAKADWS